MALLIAIALGGAFWLYLGSVIGWKALLCVWGILIALALLGTGDD